MIIETVYDAFEADLRSRRVSPTSIRECRTVRRRLCAYLRERSLDADTMRKADIQEFFASSGWATSTQHARLTWVRGPLAFAVDELELLDRNPAARVKLQRQARKPIRTIPTDGLRAARDACRNERAYALWALLAYTGMRVGEICGGGQKGAQLPGLTWDGVSFTDPSLTFVRKGGDTATIPMHPEVARALKRLGVWRDASPWVIHAYHGGPLSHNGRARIVASFTPAPFTAHDYRHTVASSLEHNGAREAAIYAVLGWSPDGSIRLRHYTALPIPVLLREMLKLYADDPL